MGEKSGSCNCVRIVFTHVLKVGLVLSGIPLPIPIPDLKGLGNMASFREFFSAKVCDMSDLLKAETPQFSLVLESMRSIRDDIKVVNSSVNENKELMQQGFANLSEFAPREKNVGELASQQL